MSFGCAGDVSVLVEEALLDLPPKAMAVENSGEEDFQPMSDLGIDETQELLFKARL